MRELLSHLARNRPTGADQRLAPAAALHVEVIADLVCPFCYIGKRRLDQAMQAVQGPSDVSWYPYQLNPDMPEDGMTLEDYLAMRFGSIGSAGYRTRCVRTSSCTWRSRSARTRARWPRNS
jgi:hypothetical protein